MNTIEIRSDRFTCDLSADAAPAVEVRPGSVLRIHTRSALDRDVGLGAVRATSANPATGPIAVTGAAPGGALKIELLDIVPESPGHISASFQGGHQEVPLEAGHAVFKGIRIPLNPSLGVLGVAKPEGSWNTMDCGCFGGNLDTTDLAGGATVFLPVFRPGGLFVVGDVHAVMGDGEIGGQGLECAATVTVRVGVEPQPLTDHVYLFRRGCLMVLGTGARLEDACRDAAVAMMKLLEKAGVLDEFSAMKLLGLAGDMRFGQQCCRIKSVRVSLPAKYVPALRESETGRRDAEDSESNQ